MKSSNEMAGSLARHTVPIAVVIGALILIRAALPSVAEWAVVSAARTYLGLDASIRDVDLRILTGRIAVEGLSLAPPGEAPAQGEPIDSPEAVLTWDRVAVNLVWWELLRGRLHLTKVEILSPNIRIARQADGSLDPLAGAAPTELPPGAEDDAPGMPIEIDRVLLRSARLQIVDAADASPPLALDLDDVEFEDFKLEGGGFTLGGISLRGPRLRVDRESVLRPWGADAPAESTVPATGEEVAGDANTAVDVPSAAPRTRSRIESADIEAAEFSLQIGDRDVSIVASLHAEHIALDANEAFPVEVSLEADDGTLELNGRLLLSPFNFAGELRWNNLPIPMVALSLRPDLADWVRACRSHGEASIDVDLLGSAERRASIRMVGKAEVSNLELRDPAEDALSLAWKKVQLEIEDLTIPIGDNATDPLRIILTNVHIDEPSVAYTYPSDSITRLWRGPEPQAGPGVEAVIPAEPEPGNSPPPEIRLSRLAIENGSLKVVDEGVTPDYEGTARDVTADLRGLSLGGPVEIDSIDATLRLRGDARARIGGRWKSPSSAIDVELERVALPAINGYAAGVGIEVIQGALSSESKVRQQKNGWTLDNDLTLLDLKLDKRGSAGLREAIGMPLDVILALLRDPGGNISLPLRITIEAGATETSISSIVGGALRQALVGAASIPLKGVGSLLRLGSDGGVRMEAIPSEPGFPTPSPGAQARLEGLVGLFEARPGLGVTLTGSAGDDDRDGLAGRVLAERLESGGDLPEIDDVDGGLFSRRRVERALRERARGEVSVLEESDEERLLAYVEATEVPPHRFSELALQRAQRVRDDLVTVEGVSPDRIRISEDLRDDDPGVEIGFFLLE